MDAILHDLRYALRSLARSPGFTTVAVLTLAVAVGANTAILTIADAVLFRPLPYSDPESVYVLLMRQPSTGRRSTMVPHEYIQAINDRHGGLSEVAMADDGPRVVVTTADGTESVPTLAVSANYFDVLGVRPARGRLFDARDAAEPGRSAVLSHPAWQQRFGGDDQIPFVYVLGNTAAPLRTIVVRTRDRQDAALRDIRREVAALASGVQLTATWWSETIDGLSTYRNPRFQTIVLGTFAAFALGLTGLGVFGVVSFLVAMRTKEMGIRMAMGAPPASLVSFVLRQAFTPIAIGIMIGLLLTHWARRLAEAQLFKVETRDPAMLVAAVLTVVLATLAAAYLPARRAGRVDPVQALRTE